MPPRRFPGLVRVTKVADSRASHERATAGRKQKTRWTRARGTVLGGVLAYRIGHAMDEVSHGRFSRQADIPVATVRDRSPPGLHYPSRHLITSFFLLLTPLPAGGVCGPT